MHLVQQDYAAAAAAARQAVEWCQRGLEDDTLTYGDAEKLKSCLELQAAASWYLGERAAAIAATERSVAVIRQAAEYFSASPQQSLVLARALGFRRMIYRAAGDAEQASQAGAWTCLWVDSDSGKRGKYSAAAYTRSRGGC